MEGVREVASEQEWSSEMMFQSQSSVSCLAWITVP